jgi:uncharacterized protein
MKLPAPPLIFGGTASANEVDNKRNRSRMNVPSKPECYRMMGEMKMLDHIVAHCLLVCEVAVFLADRLKARGMHLNRDLIRAAALLHDITKTRSFQTREDHAITGEQFLIERGYPEIGHLVRQHVRLDEYPNPVVLGEAAIINYADKRVLHDKVVTLEKRMNYILEKYARLPEDEIRIRRLWEKTEALEKEIFRSLPFSPEDLPRLVNAEDQSSKFFKYRKSLGLLSAENR